MMKNPKTLLISIAVHIFVLTSTLYLWDNYVRTPNKQSDTKVKLNSHIVTNTKKEIIPVKQVIQEQTKLALKPLQKITPKLISKPEPEPIIAKAKTQIKEKQVVKKIQKQKQKKIVKNYNLELKKLGNMLVEQVPNELAYVNKKRIFKSKSIKKTVIKKRQTTKKYTAKKTIKKTKPKQKSYAKKTIKKDKTKQKTYAKTYLQTNEKKISNLLQKHLFYPSSIKKKGIIGEVIVKFKLSTNKRIYDIKVIKSNNKMLNRLAMKTITDLSGKLPKPKKNIILHLPVEYKLNL